MSTHGPPAADHGEAQPGRTEGAPLAGVAARPEPLDSEALLRGRRMVEIAHNGEVYRLQATRHGKLILTK
jgi:hemin uptake protein HemP